MKLDREKKCKEYFDEDRPDFIVEYRGNFKEQIDKVDYACGNIINSMLGIISVSYENLERLKEDVPSIIYVEPRSIFVLQDISPTDVDTIKNIQANKYLNLTGKGIVVGIIDTGINYLNKEFINEDGTSRIESIWDQTINSGNEVSSEVYLGKVYSNDEINNAINERKEGRNPYLIVPSKDDLGHGTKIASIIGAKGYDKRVQGVAPECTFVIVKLVESFYNKKVLKENNIPYVPTYNSAEIISAVEYLKNYAIKTKQPMVMVGGIGATEGTHEGNNLLSRYLTYVANLRGIVLVAGVGNEGFADGHVSGTLSDIGSVKTIELLVSKDMKSFRFTIWSQRPTKIAVNIIGPSGEMTEFIKPKINRSKEVRFIYVNTDVKVTYHLPEINAGNESVDVEFKDIKEGIWKIQLKAEIAVSGRYDIWLPPYETIPEGTKFLEPDSNTTLTFPATARKVVTVAYYNSVTGAKVPQSGKGFNANGLINPDVTTDGINILATNVDGEITTLSGSSAATAIAAGVSVLLLQWGIIQKNDITMYSTKARSYLLYGARRDSNNVYPNRAEGYGYLDIKGVFDVIAGKRIGFRNQGFIEYEYRNLLERIPNDMWRELNGK